MYYICWLKYGARDSNVTVTATRRQHDGDCETADVWSTFRVPRRRNPQWKIWSGPA